MAITMRGRLISILCREEIWTWDACTCTIAFKKDGTGELRCQDETQMWIANEFEWKMQKIEHFDKSVNIDSVDEIRKHPTPYLISQFDIEIKLMKNWMPSLRSQIEAHKYKEPRLVDDAFRPKTYIVRLERGNFLCHYDTMCSKENEFTPRFALRLVFDKSPYPPQQEWKQPGWGPDVREWKEFYGQKSSELKTLANKHVGWEKCVVS